jgi:hypothetical protein
MDNSTCAQRAWTPIPNPQSRAPACYPRHVERKIFWLVFAILGLVADYFLPLWWALGATIPIGILSWWVAYRLIAEWF